MNRMSDDLISRKALLDALEKGKDKCYEGKTIIEVMQEIVREQKTAFDREKVIEELKEEDCIIDDEKGNRAVEIIRKGGIE